MRTAIYLAEVHNTNTNIHENGENLEKKDIPHTCWHEFHKKAETKHPKYGNLVFLVYVN